MKKFSCLLILLCMGVMIFAGCKSEKKTETTDYSTYNFVDVKWTRETECDTETIRFLANGEFTYSCACGDSVNDSDVVDSYSYDDATKMFTLNCCEEIDEMITEIKLISCDEEKLELDFAGEIRVFFAE